MIKIKPKPKAYPGPAVHGDRAAAGLLELLGPARNGRQSEQVARRKGQATDFNRL